jgi:imidazolonepropionase-like amidohydrolase
MTETIVFRNAFLIDGNGGDPAPNTTVVISDGTIMEVAPDDNRTKVASGRMIDVKGKTLMPGLIDAHVHPNIFDVDMERLAALHPAVYVHRTTKNLETDIDLGFTTVRDAAVLDLGFREAIEQGLIRGPRLFLSVRHLMQSSWGDDEGSRLQDRVGIFPKICDGPDEVRRGARQALGRGADQIKVMADGEVVTESKSDRARPGQWKFTVDELRAAVETAEAAGTYVMAHVYSPKAIQNCLAAGVRSLEHGNLMDGETAELIAKNGAFYVPTLTVYDVLAREGREGLDAYTLEKLEAVRHKGQRALELAYRAGVKIASGSDIVGLFQELKGREFALKAEVMTPMEAIVSATRTNAELIQMSDRLGTVEPNKLADLIVVDGNPLEDLTLFEHGLERVVLVMKEGKTVKDIMEAF